MRETILAPGELYHIFNRSNDKQPIFIQDRDFVRFLFLLLYLQSPNFNPKNTKRQIDYFTRDKAFKIDKEVVDEIISTREVELVSFLIAPNHFHLIVEEIERSGISHYLQRVEAGYAKYLQFKYKMLGHTYQGPFGSVHISDNRQLLYLSSYLHKHPRTFSFWKKKDYDYSWSSYPDFVKENRWGNLLKPEIILGQFSSPQEYITFVDDSIAKEKNMLGPDHLSAFK